MPQNRAAHRSVFLFLSSSPDNCVGGCMHDYFNQYDLYLFVDVLVLPQAVDASFETLPDGRLYDIRLRGSQTTLQESTAIPLSPGDYIITPKHESVNLCVSDELYLPRILSPSVSPRDTAFRETLRQRDRGCVVSEMLTEVADEDGWEGFHAAHIWPLSKGAEWLRQNAGRWITDSDALSDLQKMNSPQNGMMLMSLAHALFSSHNLAVNPKASYKVYIFKKDSYGYRNKYMNVRARENGDIGVRDNLLSWHFRQCVLANMRGPVNQHGTTVLMKRAMS